MPWFLHSLWVIPGTVLLVFFARHYWKFTLQLPKITKLHFMLAFVIYVGGALCMEMVGSYFAELEGQQHLTYALLATLEEFMEMIGVIVFIYGLLSYLGNWQKEIQLQIQIMSAHNSSI